MKRILTMVVAGVIAALGAPAIAQQSSEATGSTGETRLRGTIENIDPSGRLELEIQGSRVELEGTRRQVQGYNEGDEVQVTVVPRVTAESVTPLEEASLEQQTEANEPGNNVIVGRAADVQQDSVVFEVPGEGSRQVQLPNGGGSKIALGESYVVELGLASDKANQFELRDIQKR